MKHTVTDVNIKGATDEIIALKIALSLLTSTLLSRQGVEDLANSLRSIDIPQCAVLADEIEKFKRP